MKYKYINSNLLYLTSRSNKRLFVLLCIVFFNLFLFAQTEKINKISVKNIDDFFSKYDRAKHSKNLDSVIVFEKEIILFEKQIENTKNNKLITYFYQQKVENYFYDFDYQQVDLYLKKWYKVLETYNDKTSLGHFYECLGAIKYEQKKHKESEFYTKKAIKILDKYGDINDKIDCNYNLAILNKNKKEWSNSIKYLLLTKKHIIDSKAKNSRMDYVYLFLAEGYLNLNQIKPGKEYLTLSTNSHRFKQNENEYLSKYYFLKGLLESKLKNSQEASESFVKSTEYLSNFYTEKDKFIQQYAAMVKTLLIKKSDANKSFMKLKSIKQDEINRNYILVVSSIIVLLLFALYLIRLRKANFKKKALEKLEKNKNELKYFNEKILETLKTKNSFINTLFFELQTPLKIIKKISENINSETESVSQKELNLLNFSSDYLLKLVNNIIEFNIDKKDKSIVLNNQSCDLKLLLLEITNSYNFIEENNKILVSIDENISNKLLFDEFVFIKIFNNIIEFVLKNSLTNEIQFIAKLSSTTETIENLEFLIQCNKIDKFIHNEQNVFTNNSIELDKTKTLLSLYNSNLNFESNINSYTISFQIKLEITENIISKNSNELQLEKSETIILLVEDNKINQMLAKKIITSKGYNCEVANDGQEAVNMVVDKDYSLILMDIMMPVMDGFEATNEIKKIKPHIPIVALTALSEEINKDRFVDSKFEKTLTKPVNVEDLCNTIIENVNKATK